MKLPAETLSRKESATNVTTETEVAAEINGDEAQKEMKATILLHRIIRLHEIFSIHTASCNMPGIMRNAQRIRRQSANQSTRMERF